MTSNLATRLLQEEPETIPDEPEQQAQLSSNMANPLASVQDESGRDGPAKIIHREDPARQRQLQRAAMACRSCSRSRAAPRTS